MNTANQNQIINEFRKKSSAFNHIFKNYKKIVNLSYFVESLLTLEQQKILEIQYGDTVIGFPEQILICFENRYDSGITYEDITIKISRIFKQYKFLFETDLEVDRIRTILLRSIMEITTFGSQCFYHRRNRIIWRKDIYWKPDCTGAIFKVRKEIEKRYPQLPRRTDNIKWKEYSFAFSEELFINRYATKFKNLEAEDFWVSEFLKQTKWFFEKLNSCEEEYRNKYRERILQIANLFIGEDKNSTHTFSRNMQLIYKPKIKNIPVEINTNKYLDEIIEAIMECFEENDVVKLSEIDSELNCWIFKKQLSDRYYSKYPSFASLEEIKEYIKKKSLIYKPLLKGEEKLIAKEIFLDELEQELFVSKSTHDWNREMFKNLSISETKNIFPNVMWAIDQIVKSISNRNLKKLILKLEEKEYDLKAQLIARWRRAWLAQGKKAFNKKLLEIFTQTPYHFQNWENKEISRIDLQIFLELIDSCFLFPKQGRIIKILLNKDNTGDISKLKKNIICGINESNRSRWFSSTHITIFFIIAIHFLIIAPISFLINPK